MDKKLSFFDTHDKKDCTGCGLCISKCPQKCISFLEDVSGFYYPHINNEICIRCNLCKKICPLVNQRKESVNQNVFYGYSKNISSIKKSSSGGLFFEIAKKVIEKKGVVFGAAFDNEFLVSHICVDNLKELEKLRGSKYVQSDISKAILQIEEHLKTNKIVLFSGTPCQVSCIKNIFKNNPNLYTIDIICHGVPSQKMWKDYLTKFEIQTPVKDINFRDKEKDGWGNCLKIVSNKTFYFNSFKSSYYEFFEKNLLLRESCYKCDFSNMNRVGDITLGDYWGVEKIEDISYKEYRHGISLIICNTKKGNILLDNIHDNVFIKKVKNLDFLKFNPNLVYPSIKPTIYFKFMNDYYNNGYSYIEKKYFKKNLRYFKSYLISIIPKRIKFEFKRRKVS